MKVLKEQYNLIKEGKGNKAHFLKTAFRLFPHMLSPVNTYEDTVHILKNKSSLNEFESNEEKLYFFFSFYFKILRHVSGSEHCNQKRAKWFPSYLKKMKIRFGYFFMPVSFFFSKGFACVGDKPLFFNTYLLPFILTTKHLYSHFFREKI